MLRRRFAQGRPLGAQTGMRPVGRLTLRAAAGGNGQTCLSVAATRARCQARNRLHLRVVGRSRSASARRATSPPLPDSRWTAGAKWVGFLRRNEAGWTVDVLPPSGAPGPGLR